MIIFEFLAVFVLILILSLGVSLFALPVAYLFKHIVPSTRPFCTRCLTGWKTKRGLVIRLVWVPLQQQTPFLEVTSKTCRMAQSNRNNSRFSPNR